MVENNNNGYDILTPEEVILILDIGRNAVYSLLNSGELKGFRVGRRWKIPLKAVVDYIDRHTSVE